MDQINQNDVYALVDFSNISELAMITDDAYMNDVMRGVYSESEAEHEMLDKKAEATILFSDDGMGESTDPIEVEIDDEILDDIYLSDGLDDILDAIEGNNIII